MKKLLVFLSFMLLLFGTTGCEVTKVDNQSIDSIIETVLLQDNNLYNTVFEGYKYYIPQGMTLRNKSEYNSELTYRNQLIYLYVDVNSYYHKIKLDYEEKSTSFYSKKIENGEQAGYLEITKFEDNYFVELMYNYAKIEAYVEADVLKDALIEMCYVLSSVTYQDKVLETLVGDNVLNYEEETFNIFTPKGETNDFIDYVNEYDVYYDKDNKLPEEDLIETEEDTELTDIEN